MGTANTGGTQQMATWQRYEPSLGVRAVVWPLSFVLAFGYIFALRALYRAALDVFPDTLVWAATVLVVATFVRWILMAIMESKRSYYVEDEPVVHDAAA
jgi:hypothetical protein